MSGRLRKKATEAEMDKILGTKKISAKGGAPIKPKTRAEATAGYSPATAKLGRLLKKAKAKREKKGKSPRNPRQVGLGSFARSGR